MDRSHSPQLSDRFKIRSRPNGVHFVAETPLFCHFYVYCPEEEIWRVWLECNRAGAAQSIVEACAMQANQSGDLANKASYLFSVRIRRLMLCLGLFVAYSQLVSIGLTGVYRYSLSEPALVNGGSPGIFDALMLFQPPDRIGTINDLQAKGLAVHYEILEYAVWTIVAPILGSAALFLAYAARARSAAVKLLLVIGSAAGIGAAVMIKLHEFKSGSLRWAVMSMTASDGPLAEPVHPIYGYAEFFGSLILPVVVYLAITLSVIVMACKRPVDRSTQTRQT